MSHACATLSIPIATAYDTLGETGLAHSLNEPECVGLFTNAELLHVADWAGVFVIAHIYLPSNQEPHERWSPHWLLGYAACTAVTGVNT